MQEEEKKGTIWHKIEPNHKYRVFRKDYNGQTFYNIQVSQKQYDGTTKKYYVPITFKKGVEVQNETDIVILKGMENLRENKNAPEKVRPYCPIMSYMIVEFEEYKSEEMIMQNAYDEFRENLNENEMVSISDDFLD